MKPDLLKRASIALLSLSLVLSGLAAEKRISELPNTNQLAAGDLFELSVQAGAGYTSRSISGQSIYEAISNSLALNGLIGSNSVAAALGTTNGAITVVSNVLIFNLTIKGRFVGTFIGDGLLLSNTIAAYLASTVNPVTSGATGPVITNDWTARSYIGSGAAAGDFIGNAGTALTNLHVLPREVAWTNWPWWAGRTNTFTLDNGYYWFQASGDCTVSNLVVAGAFGLLRVDNTNATAIQVWDTTPGVKWIGPASWMANTNGISVPSGASAYLSWVAQAGRRTNVSNTVEQ